MSNTLSIRIGNFRMGIRTHTSKHKFSSQLVFAHVADTFGITNKFKNTKQQSLLIDYDNMKLEDIEIELNNLDEEYKIGDSFVFKSSKDKFHAINPSLLESTELCSILLSSNLIDTLFRKHYFIYGDNTIRMWSKYTEKSIEREITFEKLILGNNSRTKHRGLLLAIMDNIPYTDGTGFNNYIKENYKLDNSSTQDLICKRYETVNW